LDFKYDTERYTYREIDPINAWCEYAENPGGRRTVLLGGSSDVLYTLATYDKSDKVVVARSEVASFVVLPHRVQLHKCDADASRLYLVCRTPDHFVMQIIETVPENGAMAYVELRTRSQPICIPSSDWEPVDVSKHGHVAFRRGAKYLIWNPRGSVHEQQVPLSTPLENRSKDQHCFVGREEEYFVGCGGSLSTMEILKLSEGTWRSWRCLEAATYSFEDPGTDGQSLIVRAVPSQDDMDKQSEMLWAFEIDASSGLNLKV
jgi:hypothetical protein